MSSSGSATDGGSGIGHRRKIESFPGPASKDKIDAWLIGAEA